MTDRPAENPTAADGTRDEEEDDHDLLTYNESGARLAEEIRAVEEELSTADGERRTALEERRTQLHEAASRNTRWASVDTNAASFLAYKGPGSSLDATD